MQHHTLSPNTKNKKSARVGRGGKRGKTAGRGTKGQNARAGRKKRPEMRDIIKKLPKRRGQSASGSHTSIKVPAYPISLSAISAVVKDGETVTPTLLVERKALRLPKSVSARVKVLASGSIDKKVTLEGFILSAKAQEAIEKAGGKVA
jgi:large subunit ribosomal protein L15